MDVMFPSSVYGSVDVLFGTIPDALLLSTGNSREVWKSAGMRELRALHYAHSHTYSHISSHAYQHVYGHRHAVGACHAPFGRLSIETVVTSIPHAT